MIIILIFLSLKKRMLEIELKIFIRFPCVWFLGVFWGFFISFFFNVFGDLRYLEVLRTILFLHEFKRKINKYNSLNSLSCNIIFVPYFETGNTILNRRGTKTENNPESTKTKDYGI